jgi:hypothetical protein
MTIDEFSPLTKMHGAKNKIKYLTIISVQFEFIFVKFGERWTRIMNLFRPRIDHGGPEGE